MSAAARRVDELRARRQARAADRAAFEARRMHGLQARHAAKMAHLAAARENATTRTEEELTEEPENSVPPAQGTEPEVA